MFRFSIWASLSLFGCSVIPTYTVSGHAGGLVSAPTEWIISPVLVRLAKITLKITALMPEQGVRLLIVHRRTFADSRILRTCGPLHWIRTDGEVDAHQGVSFLVRFDKAADAVVDAHSLMMDCLPRHEQCMKDARSTLGAEIVSRKDGEVAAETVSRSASTCIQRYLTALVAWSGEETLQPSIPTELHLSCRSEQGVLSLRISK
jgi:hypothetical protein